MATTWTQEWEYGGSPQYSGWIVGSGGGDSFRPPSSGSGGAGDGGIPAPAVGFQYDPLNPTGSVVVSNPTQPATGQGAQTPLGASLNFGWNSGAYSLEKLAPGWVGLVAFDLPDVQGARPGGVAIGLAPVSALPTVGRSGYGHLRHGLVFTADRVKVIFAGAVARELPYADIRAARAEGSSTDQVYGLMYGSYVKWVVNGVALFGGVFSMPENYALDATLYSAFDAVDNPKFIAGPWDGDFPGLENGSLNGALPRLAMTGDASRGTELVGELPALSARLSQTAYSDLGGALAGLRMTTFYSDGAVMALPRLEMRAYESKTYGAAEVALAPLQMTAGMAEPDGDVVYSVLAPSLPPLQMTATMPAVATIEAALPALAMRATWQTTYAEVSASLPGLRMIGYGGEQTPLVQIVELVGGYLPLLHVAYLSVAVVERVGGGSSAVLAVTVTADATEQVSAEDAASALQTFLADAFEQLGALERTRVVTLNAAGQVADEAEAWAVNTATNASSRYGSYGFNSFAAFGGKHYGARADGVYLLEGPNDTGRPIASGASLGMQDFGTQALKHISAVYVGVSSQGCLFLKVGDGTNSYTYRARRNDPRMKVQRFDLGRGLRTNYFTFELTSEADAFELDSVTFNVLASQRRI